LSLQNFLSCQHFLEVNKEGHPTPWCFFFPLLEAGRWVRAPRHIANWGQVPSKYRRPLEVFFRKLAEEDERVGRAPQGAGRGILAACPDPWQDYDEDLWGSAFTEGWNEALLIQRAFWDERAAAIGLSQAWTKVKALIRGGCLDEEVLLQVVLDLRPGAAQVTAFLQVLNDCLKRWCDHAASEAPTRDLLWKHQPVPEVRWDANRLWGEWRQACAEKDWPALNQAALRLYALTTEHHGYSAFHREAWGEVQRQMWDYADQPVSAALKGMEYEDQVAFFESFPFLNFEAYRKGRC
jgi:hypothetical protein